MQAFPHHYVVAASLEDNKVILQSPGLESISSGAPAEFGGPGDLWSPETLFAASIADCFILSFKAIATASKFSYSHISCDVEAILDRVDRVTRFTEVTIKPCLTIDSDDLQATADKLLHKAETTCLITNSLTATIDFQPKISVG
jgi:organic hydroperoxide reductase OsmC/OhrA